MEKEALIECLSLKMVITYLKNLQDTIRVMNLLTLMNLIKIIWSLLFNLMQNQPQKEVLEIVKAQIFIMKK